MTRFARIRRRGSIWPGRGGFDTCRASEADRRSLGVSGEDPKKRGRVSSCVMCDSSTDRSRAAHPGPDPDETYAMTVYVSDTIDAGSDDQEVRFAPSPATSTASRHRDGRMMRFASHRRRRPRRPPVPFASRPAAAAPAPAVPLTLTRLPPSLPTPDPSEPTFVPLEDEDPDAAAWEDPSEGGVLTRVLEACEEGEDADEVASLLGRMSVSVDAVGTDGDAPLHLASLYGHAAVVRVLLEKGAEPRRAWRRRGDAATRRRRRFRRRRRRAPRSRERADVSPRRLTRARRRRGDAAAHGGQRGTRVRGHASRRRGASRDASSDAGLCRFLRGGRGDVERACVPDRVER